jgi:hypothetical protein
LEVHRDVSEEKDENYRVNAGFQNSVEGAIVGLSDIVTFEG